MAVSEWKVLHNKDEISEAVSHVAHKVNQDFFGEITVLCVMNGGMQFTKDLMSELTMPVLFDFCQLSSYGHNETGSTVRWLVEPKAESIRGKTVLICDDIYDKGHTLDAVIKYCEAIGADRIFTAVAFNKICENKKSIRIDYQALVIEDRFVFGYGLDLNGLHRGFSDLMYKV